MATLFRGMTYLRQKASEIQIQDAKYVLSSYIINNVLISDLYLEFRLIRVLSSILKVPRLLKYF